ncbi:MAG: hypothetical protein ABSA78_09380 [Candidatus Sulfotelmatobacter sp.]
MMPNPSAGSTLTCAVGMALLAHGLEPQDGYDYERLMAIYPWLRQKNRYRCPDCRIRLQYTGILAHPFDRHVITGKMSFDRFCDWLAQSEADAAHFLFKWNAGLIGGSLTGPSHFHSPDVSILRMDRAELAEGRLQPWPKSHLAARQAKDSNQDTTSFTEALIRTNALGKLPVHLLDSSLQGTTPSDSRT